MHFFGDDTLCWNINKLNFKLLSYLQPLFLAFNLSCWFNPCVLVNSLLLLIQFLEINTINLSFTVVAPGKLDPQGALE